MAENSYKKKPKKKNTGKSQESANLEGVLDKLRDRRLMLALGFTLMFFSIYLLAAFLSYLFTGQADQSVVQKAFSDEFSVSSAEVSNWLGLSGAVLSHLFIFRWFGLASFILIPNFFLWGYHLVYRKSPLSIASLGLFSAFALVWISLLLGNFTQKAGSESFLNFLSGGVGYELAYLFNGLIGWGTYLALALSLLIFIIYFFNITNIQLKPSEESVQEETDAGSPQDGAEEDSSNSREEEKEELTPEGPFENENLEINHLSGEETEPEWEVKDNNKPKKKSDDNVEPKFELTVEEPVHEHVEESHSEPEQSIEPEEQDSDLRPELEVEEAVEESQGRKMEHYDPKLDLSSYKYPHLNLLTDFDSSDVKVTKEELEANKDKIVETLINFKIGISSIKATIGPTVTLYEIVPEAGVKISKIKNLEDDIALSLAALGIRIIAPIPGKGTIGIEVPNKNRELVSFKSMISTEKYQKSEMALPVALGKTISNEALVVDLAKMPHVLVAGATGQGKSVGINVLLASLLYKKHPSQLKFVLIDPKKVELTLYNKIERHFLAKLPDSEEPIITDTSKVVNTLNSLCIEMDNRYELLKDAGCRNIKEYNEKFIHRKLNPTEGHRYLPYIVLVIDELADLMMTAGKEVETPIARLAQLARAIGIHLVVATQRPSVNVITGIIKANFPARISFKVTSKVDSRTILDTGGSEQLIGMGDMLLSSGSDMIRLQCPFLDTPEVDSVCDFISNQRGYETAYMLPEYVGDEADGVGDIDLSERDVLFEEAARTIVMHQQGSTSLLQRKLKLGYNRAGRLIDQLEAAGIVGSFEGSKAREVLVSDEYALEQLLNNIDQNNSNE